MELRSFIGLDEAIKRSLKYSPRQKSTIVPLLEAVGKFSAEDIVSPSDFPLSDRSAVDGYAVNSRETISSSKTNPSSFNLVGKLFPSSSKNFVLKTGESVRIATGSKVPKGADSVVMLEDASEKDGRVDVYVPLRKYQNVGRKGEDLRKGFPILRRGERVYPPHVAALLECGIEKVAVISLSIGIVSTGDELVSGIVRNSTQPMLQSYFQRKGFVAVGHGVVPDVQSAIEDALDLVKEDVIIVTGGTGPGERDVLPSVMEKSGKFVFRGLKIRPGRTTSFGIYNGKPVFMLSGLPVAALIASENVVLEAIYRWFNLKREVKEIGSGELGRSLVNTLGFRSFVRVRVEEKNEKTFVYPTRVTGSGVIYSMINADGILVMDENSEGIAEGERVSYEVLRW